MRSIHEFGTELVVQLARLAEGAAFIRHFARKRHGAGEQIAFDHAIDQAQLQRLGRADRLAGNAQIDGRGHSHQARQSLGAFGAGNDAEIHFGLANLRIGDRHAIVPGHGDFIAAAERGAMNGHHHGLAGVFDSRQDVVKLRRAASPPRRRQLQLLDVGTGDERSSSADDDDGASRGILLRGIQSRHQTFGNAGAQRVHGRIVDGDDGDAVLRRQVYEFVHSCRSALLTVAARKITAVCRMRLYCGGNPDQRRARHTTQDTGIGEGKFDIAPGHAGMFARQGFGASALPVLDGLHDGAVVLVRNGKHLGARGAASHARTTARWAMRMELSSPAPMRGGAWNSSSSVTISEWNASFRSR